MDTQFKKSEVPSAINTLSNADISDKEIALSTVQRLTVAIRRLRDVQRDIQNTQQALVRRHAERDEDNQVKRTETGDDRKGDVIFKDEEGFHNEFDKVMNQPVDADLPVLPVEDVQKMKLHPAEQANILPIIDYGKLE